MATEIQDGGPYDAKRPAKIIEQKVGGFNVTITRKSFPTVAEWDRYLSSISIGIVRGGQRENLNRSVITAVEIFKRHFVVDGLPDGMVLPASLARQAISDTLQEMTPTIASLDALMRVGMAVQVTMDTGKGKGVSTAIYLRAPTQEEQAQANEMYGATVTNAAGEISDAGRFKKTVDLARSLFIKAEGYADCKLDSIPVHHLQIAFTKVFNELFALTRVENDEGNSESRSDDGSEV